MRFQIVFFILSFCSSLQILAQLKTNEAPVFPKSPAELDSGNVLKIKIESIERCKYDLEVQLGKVRITNRSSDTVYLLKEDIDKMFFSIKTNYNYNWPSNNIIINRVPSNKITQQDGFINRSPAILYSPQRGLLRVCYEQFPQKNHSLKTTFNEKFYYVINPRDSILVHSLMVVDIDELFLIKKLSQMEKKQITASLQMVLEYYTHGRNVPKRSFTSLPPSKMIKKIVLTLLKNNYNY